MTDREKLLEYIEIREEILNNERLDNGFSVTDLSFQTQLYELVKLREYIRAWNEPKDMGHTATSYQPTGKPCYDKPPGVPIYHKETL